MQTVFFVRYKLNLCMWHRLIWSSQTDWLTEQLTDWLTEHQTAWLSNWLTDWLSNRQPDWLTVLEWLESWLYLQRVKKQGYFELLIVGFHFHTVLMFFLSSSVGAMLEVVCVSEVSEDVAICTFMFKVSRVMMQSCYIITYSLNLMG